jgi:AraC-like DNA-binding protein
MAPPSKFLPLSASPELTLHDWACLRTELVWIYDHKILPDHSSQLHDFSKGHRAWFVRSGQVELKGPGSRRLRAGPGMWLFPPPEKARQLIPPDTHLLSIHFLCQWPSGESLFGKRQSLSIKGADYPDLEKKAAALARLVGSRFPDAQTGYGWEKAGYPFFLQAQSLFLDWLSEWFRLHVRQGTKISNLMPRDDRVILAVRCLNEAALDQGFPSALLQEQTRLGEAQLNRLFLQSLRLSTRKYWERRRLEFAKSCLESSVMPVKEIAWRLGFKSDSHFVIWFRRLSGQRPGQYRSESGSQEIVRTRLSG